VRPGEPADVMQRGRHIGLRRRILGGRIQDVVERISKRGNVDQASRVVTVWWVTRRRASKRRRKAWAATDRGS
jgi:hypothetical protein